MSIDYPFYEELCRLKHRATWWWIIGDRLYYLGLLSAIILLVRAFVKSLIAIFRGDWEGVIGDLVCFVVMAGIWLLGNYLKDCSYQPVENGDWLRAQGDILREIRGAARRMSPFSTGCYTIAARDGINESKVYDLLAEARRGDEIKQ